jgi:hypothetical protein
LITIIAPSRQEKKSFHFAKTLSNVRRRHVPSPKIHRDLAWNSSETLATQTKSGRKKNFASEFLFAQGRKLRWEGMKRAHER